MADTITPVVAANLLSTSVAGASVVLFGIQTGLDYPTLIAGVLGGATALSYLEPSKMTRRGFEVISASLLAGYSSPMLTKVVEHSLAKLDMLSETSPSSGLQLVIAFVVGYMAHGIILPGLRKIGASYIRRHSND